MNGTSEQRRRHAGADWSWQDHAVCVVDDAGAVVQRVTVTHSAAGLDKLVRVLQRHDVNGVAIEALTDFAADSRQANPRAADIYNRARARGARHPHAVRILARAWIRVIWRCWTYHTHYDTTRHSGLLKFQQATNP
jgi:hypothetical protein